MGKVKTGTYNPLPIAPIVLVGANVHGMPNYLTVGFVNGVNVKPAIVCVSLNKNHHTPQGILENKTFSLNIPSGKSVVETDYCGLVSGKTVDKSTIFTTFYGELETAPMITEFPITCECRLTGQQVEFAMDTVYFGEVMQVYVNEEMLDENRNIDMLKTNPLCYSGLENRYRTLGKDMGQGWRIGRQYTVHQDSSELGAVTSPYQWSIVERPSQTALTIRTQVSLVALATTIGKSLTAIIQYASDKGYVPLGPPFVAYHGVDGQEQDVEMGFPFTSDIQESHTMHGHEIPGGKLATYHHVGPYDQLPDVRTALEQWLKAHGHTKAGATYEIYLNDPQTTAPERLETEIMCPLIEHDLYFS